MFHRYEEYQKYKQQPVRDPSQPGIGQFSTHAQPLEVYSETHPKQRSMTISIINDLIVGCNLPLTIVENVKFRHFLFTADPKYKATNYRSVVKKLESSVTAIRTKIKEELAEAEHVSLTVDIWSDRRMRGFLGVTGHYLTTNKGLCLNSCLLACSRFQGSHTGERIAEAFEAICDEYDIRHKLDFVLCDNAANMKKAFSICFPQEEEDQVDDAESLDDPDIWEDLSEADQETVDQVNDTLTRYIFLSCDL